MALGLGTSQWLGHLQRDTEIVCETLSLVSFLVLLCSMVPRKSLSQLSLQHLQVCHAGGKELFRGSLACMFQIMLDVCSECFKVFSLLYFSNAMNVIVWLGGRVVRMLDLRPIGREFES